jgi:hypothetical protein
LAGSLVTSGCESELSHISTHPPSIPYFTYEGLSFKEVVELFLFSEELNRAIREKLSSSLWDENNSSTAARQ